MQIITIKYRFVSSSPLQWIVQPWFVNSFEYATKTWVHDRSDNCGPWWSVQSAKCGQYNIPDNRILYTRGELSGLEEGLGFKSNFGDCILLCPHMFAVNGGRSSIYANQARACDGHKRIEHVAAAVQSYNSRVNIISVRIIIDDWACCSAVHKRQRTVAEENKAAKCSYSFFLKGVRRKIYSFKIRGKGKKQKILIR